MSQAISYSVVTGSRGHERQRLLVRRDPAAWPFVWRGLLPLLALLLILLYAVWPFAKHEIEANVTRSIAKALADRGLKDVVVKASGQHVLLTGQLPAGVTPIEALAIAQRATCPTWAGPQVCAELVLVKFDGNLPLNPPAQASPLSLPSLPSGASSAAAAAPATAASNDAQACDKALVAALGGQRVEFAVGSARLLPASQAVLDQVAKAHGGCKLVVRIEGHTDDRGAAATNQTLSLARASAVRAELIRRGIPADRLVAEGFGSSRPLADNATNEGRQQNRRIEFKAVVPN
ncbi:MAG: OmpA family protein [Rubrivivax sp.]|nr:OmpA family protein [Rubrivivax sp.]